MAVVVITNLLVGLRFKLFLLHVCTRLRLAARGVTSVVFQSPASFIVHIPGCGRGFVSVTLPHYLYIYTIYISTHNTGNIPTNFLFIALS